MKVVCCRCGKQYEYDYSSARIITEIIDLKDGNIAHRIKCPHCGLQHLVVWMKIGKWREMEPSLVELIEKY